MSFFNLSCLMDALFLPPCIGFWHKPWAAPYFYPTTPFPSIFYEANYYMPQASSIFYNYTPNLQPSSFVGCSSFQSIPQINYSQLSLPQQNWSNLGWNTGFGGQAASSATTSAQTQKSDNKSNAVSTSAQNQTTSNSSTSKVTSADKIDTSKRLNLNGNEKTQLLNGTYNADYVNIGGIIHYRYDECKASDLVSIGNGQKLHRDALKAFNEMKEAARKDGVKLNCRSCYRSKSTQIGLFKKNGTSDAILKQRARVSAPPGYSEHHTGLVIDILDDVNRPLNNQYFKITKAYDWLSKHAHEYGFEQSFQLGNAQGLEEESWHWRFVGKNHENDYIFRHAIANDPQMLAKRK